MKSRFVMAAALALVAASAFAQQPRIPEDGVSDIGSFEQVPYRLEPQTSLRAEDRAALRKLEDKHIAELRGIEDRFDRDLRALRAKQESERESLMRSFAGKRP